MFRISGISTPRLESSAAMSRGRTTCQPPFVTSPCHRWPIQQCWLHPAFSLKRKKQKNKLRMLHCGLRPTKAESASFRRLTCLDGELSEQWRSDRSKSWCGGMWPLWRFFSESTASNNPLTFLFFSFEDAFTDSLQIKVSFFSYTKAQKQCGSAHQNAKRAAAGVHREEERQKERERKKSREVDDQQQREKKITKESLFFRLWKMHFLLKMDLSLSARLFCHIVDGPSPAVRRRRRHLTYIK